MTANLPSPTPEDSGELILYQTEDGQTRIEVRLSHETIWLQQRQIADARTSCNSGRRGDGNAQRQHRHDLRR